MTATPSSTDASSLPTTTLTVPTTSLSGFQTSPASVAVVTQTSTLANSSAQGAANAARTGAVAVDAVGVGRLAAAVVGAAVAFGLGF